jgi:sec-independent protein translocase protein TatA
MMNIPSVPELVIILAGIVLLFGANKLPKLGGAIGESIRNFKKGIKSPDKDQGKIDSEKSDNSKDA